MNIWRKFKNLFKREKITEQQWKEVKKFWKKECLPFCPNDEEKWEDLPEEEKREVYKIYKKCEEKK